MKKTSLGAAGALVIALSSSGAVWADPTGELIILNWLGGGEADVIHKLEEGFVAKYPDVTITEVPVTWSGDARGGIRTALLGGEKVDLLINTWPAFRAELVAAGLARSTEDLWQTDGMTSALNDSWRVLGAVDGVGYGVPWTYGNRSGMWYRPDTMENAGISFPTTMDEMIAGYSALDAAGQTPLVIPAKAWAHGELFETLFIRMHGVEAAADLVSHDISWDSDEVKATLRQLRVMLEANCCGDVNTMLATEWDNAADSVLKDGTAGYFLMGMWVNGRASGDYGLTPNVDYSLGQFPAMGLGHDDTAIVDAKEFLGITTGSNAEAADAFMAYINSVEGANIIAGDGFASPSSNVDTSLYDEVTKISAAAVADAKVIFVLGDQLPGDLADEYRVQLQRFLQDPSDASIDAVTAAIEAKAADVY